MKPAEMVGTVRERVEEKTDSFNDRKCKFEREDWWSVSAISLYHKI